MRFFITLALWLLLPLTAFAQTLPTPRSPFVNDYAEIIPNDAERALTRDLQNVLKSHGVEMTVVTANHSSDFGDYAAVEPLATDLFNAWGVGDETKNNGIMVLVAWQERAMRIELGDGYPPVYDDIAKTVTDDFFLSYFRNEQYPEGITAGALETIKRIAIPFAEGVDVVAPTASFWERYRAFIVVALMLPLILWRYLQDRIRALRRCPSCGKRHLDVERLTHVPATREKSGAQELITTCRNCGYNHSRHITLSRKSSSSSGFSGGRSSGGGASGRW